MKKQLGDIPYGEILRTAFDITWKNRFLWWFGLFVSFAGSTLNFNFSSSGTKNNTADDVTSFYNDFTKNELSPFHSPMELIHKYKEPILNNWHWIAIIFVIMLIFFLFLGVLGRGALIKSIGRLGKKEKVNFRTGIRDGEKYFWPVLAVGVVTFSLIIAAIIVMTVPVIFLFANKSFFSGIILTVLAVLILIPLLVLISYARLYGNIYVVLSDLKTGASMENACLLFSENVSASLITGIILLSVGLVLVSGLMLLLVPLIVIVLTVYSVLGKIGLIIAMVLGLIVLVIIILAQSIFQVFSQSVWLLFFLEIAGPAKEEKIEEPVLEMEKEKALPTTGNAVKTVENKN